MIREFCTLGVAVFTCSAEAALIHQYTFDSGVTDSVGTDHGTLTNGASVSAGVLNLDGSDDYIQFGVNLVPTTGSRTVALFARQAVDQIGSYMELISQGGSGSAFYIGHNTNNPPFIRAGDNWLSTGAAFPIDNAWHHYAIVYDQAGSQTRLYIDGSLAATTSFLNNVGGSGTNTRLGRQYGPHFEYFNGQLDDVRIYNNALTAQDVAALTSPVPEPGSLALLAGGALLLAMRRKRRA